MQGERGLSAAGVDVVFYNPLRWGRLYYSLFRNHRKLLLVDGAVGFVGGAGITDDFAPVQRERPPWHDVMLQIKGPVLIDWLASFSEIWRRASRRPLALRYPDIACGQQSGQVLVANALGQQEINRALIAHLRRARQRVWLTTPYFISTWKIRRTLRQAAQRGVDVRLLLPGELSDHPWVIHASRRYHGVLLREGVRIFECQPRFAHSKLQLCDDWVSIGSSDPDCWSQRRNLDANQAADDTELAAAAAQLFCDNLAASREITFTAWHSRPWQLRLKEWIWLRVIALLERLPKKRRENPK